MHKALAWTAKNIQLLEVHRQGETNLKKVVRLLTVIAALAGLRLYLHRAGSGCLLCRWRPHEHQQAAASQDRRQEQVHARRHAPQRREVAA